MTETSPASLDNEGGPATTAAVLAFSKLDQSEAGDVAPVVAAVNVKVRQWCGLTMGADGDWTSTPAIDLGAVMLAARLYRRRDTPDGIAQVYDSGAVFVRRSDPDVASLLGLNRPRVG